MEKRNISISLEKAREWYEGMNSFRDSIMYYVTKQERKIIINLYDVS